MGRLELAGWSFVALGLIALGIPWFLWGDATVVYGLPLWIWWHVGWLALASIAFWLFARRAWGIGIESAVGDRSAATADRGAGAASDGRADAGGDRP